MNAPTGTTNDYAKPFIGVLLVIAFIVIAYYLYKFLFGSASFQRSVDILSGTKSLERDIVSLSGDNKANAVTDLEGIADGGQYSVSFWVYIADTKGVIQAGVQKLAHLLEISDNRLATNAADRKNTLLFVGLNPLNGSLVVRQSTSNPEDVQINNSLTAPSGNSYPLSSLLQDLGSVSQSDDRCDILNGVEYQRWLLVTVVGNGRTLDVYLDGKLARSCVYKSNYSLGSTRGRATAFFGLNNAGGVKGFVSSGKFYNYALNPTSIWSLYQAGPSGTFNIASFFKNLFSVDVKFQGTADLNPK